MCVLSLIGCSHDVEKPALQGRVTVDGPRGKVFIQDPVRDFEEKYVTASVLGDGVAATFRLVSTGDGVTTAGARGELLDASGQLLFSFETLVNNESGEMTITQATPDDYLIFSKRTDDERVWERYDANGDVAWFEYAALSEEDQSRAANYYRHDLPADRLPDNASEYVNELGAFDSYYEPHAHSTLHDNPSGELLVQILSSPELPNLVVGDTPDPGRPDWLDRVCTSARACTALTCGSSYGGLLCLVCGAVASVCDFIDSLCQVFRC
jgi:hypothetical protein